MPGIDAMAAAIVQDDPAKIVIADQAGGGEGEGSLQARQGDGDIVRRAARAPELAANIGQLIALRIDINHLDLINDPIARSQQAAPGFSSAFFHNHRTDERMRSVLPRRNESNEYRTAQICL